MVQALSTAKALDWGGWLLGIFGAVISGGSGAVGAAFGSIVIDPEHFNILQGGFHHMLYLMGVVFAFNAITSLAKYLQTKPTPNEVKP